MEEIFVPIKDFPNYKISNLGKVLSFQRDFIHGKILKPQTNKKGYEKICLSLNKKNFLKSIHRLVAEAFIENYLNKKEVNHIDGNKKNNNVNNLEWCTRSENEIHKFKNKLSIRTGEKNNNVKLSEDDVKNIIKMILKKQKSSSIAKLYNVKPTTIRKIKAKKNWTHLTNDISF